MAIVLVPAAPQEGQETNARVPAEPSPQESQEPIRASNGFAIIVCTKMVAALSWHLVSVVYDYLVKFVYLCYKWSHTLKPSNAEKFNREFTKLDSGVYTSFLLLSIPAASAGKNLFQMPDGLEKDCIRTARAIMHFYVRPSTTLRALRIIYSSQARAARTRENSNFKDQVILTIQYLNEEVQNSPTGLLDFEEVKSYVKFPNPEKNYVYGIPSDKTFLEWFYSLPMELDDKELFQYEIVKNFLKYKDLSEDENCPDYFGTAKAIERLSQTDDFSSSADSVFVEALEEFCNSLQHMPFNKYGVAHSDSFVKFVDKYFSKYQQQDEQLKEEYKRIKAEILRESETENAGTSSDD